jgi:hypothetical protein
MSKTEACECFQDRYAFLSTFGERRGLCTVVWPLRPIRLTTGCFANYTILLESPGSPRCRDRNHRVPFERAGISYSHHTDMAMAPEDPLF